MSPEQIQQWTQLITALGVTLGVGITLVGTILSALGRKNAAAQVADVAAKAEAARVEAAKVSATTNRIEQKTDIAVAQNERIETKSEEVHRLVNGGMGQVLQVNATLAEKVAALTNDPKDKETAILSRNVSDNHESRA